MLKIFPVFIFILLSNNCFAGSLSDTLLIKTHLEAITKTKEFRNSENIEQLNQTADYIKSIFSEYSDSIFVQEYDVKDKIYKNVIASFGIENSKRIIIGAHYDVCEDQEGADDNASGVVGLLELARLLKGQKLNYRIDLVAYSLEEPPFFRTEYMGSYVYAKSLVENNVTVFGMISLEMIGYFKEEKSQSYPVGILSLFYGNRGNYIAFIKKFGSGKFSRKFHKKFKAAKTIKTKKLTAPAFVTGIDYSDHLNYWKFGFSAFMITDTSFFRNPNYHEKTDTMETLNIPKMGQVIDGVFKSLIKLK